MERTEGGMELNEEIIEHMMHPKNYGKLENPSGVGIGYDGTSGEYVILYLVTDGDEIVKIAYATNGCQDTVILGSVFTEMVKGTTIDEARNITSEMESKIATAPQKQQACAELVLSAFIAALINREHRIEGGDQELHKIEIDRTCAIDEEASE
jgi:nitrogen fixation NifU-like protein